MSTLLRALYSGFLVDVFLRPLRRPYLQGPGLFFALLAVATLASIGFNWLITPTPNNFDASGALALAMEALLILLSAYAMSMLARRRELVWDLSALLMAAAIMYQILLQTPAQEWIEPWLERHQPALIQPLFWLLHAWWLVIVLRLAARLHAPSAWRWIAAGLLVFCITFVPWSFLPKPAFWNQDSVDAGGITADAQFSNVAPDRNAETDADIDLDAQLSFDAEAVMYDQPRLMQDAIGKLAPHTAGKANLYLIGFAGDSEENVFRNEVEFVEQQFTRRFDAAGHTLLLENNIATLQNRPIASLTNLDIALDAVAKKMNRDEDILLLFLTSHGSEDHQLYVDMDPLPLNQIAPEDLAESLNKAPIRWKVIVISACYSGGFINALKNSTTMIITAAREDRTSFGCGTDSDITWFSKAFFADALNQTDDFAAAFANATQRISEWETRDHEKSSFPQIVSTPLIEEKLKQWRNGINLGAPVPFVPVAPAKTSADPGKENSGNLSVSVATFGPSLR